jgi:hypothetical protein
MWLFLTLWYPILVPLHHEPHVRIQTAAKWLSTLAEMGWIKEFSWGSDADRTLTINIRTRDGIEVEIRPA